MCVLLLKTCFHCQKSGDMYRIHATLTATGNMILWCSWLVTFTALARLGDRLVIAKGFSEAFARPSPIWSGIGKVALSLRFNVHFSRWTWFVGFIEAKDDGGSGDNWSYKTCTAPVKSSPPTNQHSTFYRLDAPPVTQLLVSKHWRETITFHGLAYLKLTRRFSNFVFDH